MRAGASSQNRVASQGFEAQRVVGAPGGVQGHPTQGVFLERHFLEELGKERFEGRLEPVDVLGRFVPEGSASALLPGIHLFCDRIEALEADGLTFELAAWFVFWHELTHCHLWSRGLREEYPPTLRAINVAEPFCECVAYEAVRGGVFPLEAFKGPRAVQQPQAWKRWRARRRGMPYSYFNNLMPLMHAAGPDGFRGLVVGLTRLAAAWARQELSEVASHQTQIALRSSVALLKGSMPLKEAIRMVEAFDGTASLRKAQASETQYPVWLWHPGVT
ncbi:MAG: hypothetical protein QM765_39005 [Myxococcales bacterium]